jgi:flagellar hook-basal body complex protein FliE
MVDNIQNKSAATGAIPPTGPSSNASVSPAAAGAAFHALLEKLETHARELEVQSRSVENPKDLTGAVDRAHASLQDALSLSDRLLEAYRETLARNQASGKPGSGPLPGGHA